MLPTDNEPATDTEVCLTHCWRKTASNHRSGRQRTAVERGPRSTTVVSRDDLCLMTSSILSVRHLGSATAERPFPKSGTDGSNPVPSSGQSGSREISPSGVKEPVFPWVCGAEQAARSGETGVARPYGANGRECLCWAKFQYRSMEG